MGTVTLAALRGRLSRALGNSEAEQFATYKNAELDDAINQAYLDLQHDMGVLEYRFGVALVAGTAIYVMPERGGRILRVTYDDYVLEEKSRAEMECQDDDYTTRGGDPWVFYRDATNDRSFGVYPVPEYTSETLDFDSELGTVIGLDDLVFDSEYGVITELFDGDIRYEFDGELGIIYDIELEDLMLEVWAKKEPDALDSDSDVLEFPDYLAEGVVFAAAAYLLSTIREHANKELAAAYAALAAEYSSFGKRIMGNRHPRSVEVVGRSIPQLRDRLSYDTRINVPAWN